MSHSGWPFKHERATKARAFWSFWGLSAGTVITREIKVVYHLRGQTGRFTAQVNCEQESRLVNFVPESRLPFTLISSIYRNRDTKG